MSAADPKQQLARELAAALCRGGGEVDLVRRILALAGRGPDPERAESKPSGRIGVWEAVDREGRVSYVRIPDVPRSQSWDWSDAAEIPPKGDRKRMVLLGESVARGFYSDPWITPAKILQAHLDPLEAPHGFEVIDLARNNMLSWELQALITDALALEPDGFVLFAGNNWAKLPLVEVLCDPQLCEECAVIVRTAGVGGLAAYLSDRAAAMARSVLSAVHDVPGRKIPAIVLVPEFNLLDWSHDESKPPWLAGSSTRDWWALERLARAALEARELDRASGYAQQMLDLDGGTSPEALSILARCRLGTGARDEAGRLLERARDARVWDQPQSAVPQTLSSIQQALRAERCDHVHVVDLPEIFREHLDGELPDRRLFLDYVHLTFEGAQVAMAAAARVAARVFGLADPSPRELRSRALALHDPDLAGQVHLCAAVHNAHWGQPLEIVQHHCGRALALSGGLGTVMEELLFDRRGPRWLRPLGAMAHAPVVQRFMVAHGQQESRHDAVLREAIARAMAAAGRPARGGLVRHRLDQSAIETEGGEDLLAPFYAPAWNDRSWDWSEHHYHRAHHPESTFALDAGAQRGVTLRVTYRAPGWAASARANVSVCVNGAPIAELPAVEAWRTIEVRVPPDRLVPGSNTITVRWPTLPSDGAERLAEAADRLARGALQLTPVFGEIHSLVARATG